MKTIPITHADYIIQKLSEKTGYFEFPARASNVLENCLIAPFQKTADKPLYPSLISKAGILFYLLIQNKPFQFGNSRFAVIILLMFLHLNGKWLKADKQEFYDFTNWVSQSPNYLKKQVLTGIELFLRSHLTDSEI